MMYLVELEREIELQPCFFGPRLREVLEQKLHSEVEGRCSGKYGFLVCVTGMGDVSKGQIREGLGTALFNVHYSCLVLRPHKGEVMDCVVTSVSKVGFFADAGPLQLFVSNHLIPEDFSFDSANEPAFVSSDEAVRVQAGAEVRLRIVGTRVDADEIFCVGTIKDDYLGVISQAAGIV
ncbi:hypothetical protein CVIRNUC_007531 [Coccomyxa viridis]|uniref:DNA-directed RNA polymerase II subunit RPB7 n=1 Tax=Coccomyxa viridis TaxID=1274662 RepID=A0AAV1IC78_9CHLO|nr:hypothetical protein CVIRNUC_007531 [Coccomyxa viridis]